MYLGGGRLIFFTAGGRICLGGEQLYNAGGKMCLGGEQLYTA